MCKKIVKNLYTSYLKHSIICTDSRKIEKNAIFFALKGENFDGSKFVTTALEQGCSMAVTQNANFSNTKNVLVVDNVEQCLQALAHHHRKELQIPTLCITGTNGKTTTKELLNVILSEKYNVLATKGNLNNHLGVPFTLLELTAAHNFAVIETGANHIGEIDFLCRIAAPNYGIITNVGKAHLLGFGSFEGVVQTKTEMYRYVQATGGRVFVNSDNAILSNASAQQERSLYGKPENSVWGELLDAKPYLRIRLHFDNESIEIPTQLIGSYNLENIVTAAAFGYNQKIAAAAIASAIAEYKPNNKRSEIRETATNTIWLDAYNANPVSMLAAITDFATAEAECKITILGDMLELGKYAESEHEDIVKQLFELGLTAFYLVGSNFRKAVQHIAPEHIARCYPNTRGLIEYLAENKPSETSILLKGSRGIALEKLLIHL